MKENINSSETQISDEVDSLDFWHYKPWWCQPQSIILTGILVTLGTAIVTKIVWITLLIFLVVLVWWTYFLVLVPKMIKNSSLLGQRSSLVENASIQEQDRSQNDY